MRLFNSGTLRFPCLVCEDGRRISEVPAGADTCPQSDRNQRNTGARPPVADPRHFEFRGSALEASVSIAPSVCPIFLAMAVSDGSLSAPSFLSSSSARNQSISGDPNG